MSFKWCKGCKLGYETRQISTNIYYIHLLPESQPATQIPLWMYINKESILSKTDCMLSVYLIVTVPWSNYQALWEKDFSSLEGLGKSEFVERFPELSLFYRLFSPLNSEMICIFPYFCPYAESAREIRGIFVALHINNWFSEPILI